MYRLGFLSAFSSAGATAATAPSAYLAAWSGGNADFLSSTPSSGAQPWRQVNIGAAQGPSAREIPVDQSAECLHADRSLPGSFGSFMARVFLDSWSALSSISVGLLSRMSSSFGGAALQIPRENGPRAARTATGATVSVTHKTMPIVVSVRTPWGAVKGPANHAHRHARV